MRIAPRLALVLHWPVAALVALFGAFSLIAVRSDAQQHAGPPYYLSFEFLLVGLCTLLFLAAIFMRVWKRAGWWLGITLDAAIALAAGYVVASDVICKAQVPAAFNLCMFGIFAFFGTVAVLLATRQSRNFFGVAPATEQFTGTV